MKYYQKNLFLEKLIREGRSAGIAVFFASQSPNDYDQDDFNFKELLEFSLILNCDQINSSGIQKLTGCSSAVSHGLQNKIPKLSPFQIIMKSSKNKDGYIEFLGDKFYEEYKD